MAHSFLLESGYWNVRGHLLQPKSPPIALEGSMQIAWKRENWFKITTTLNCEDETTSQIIYQCRGNLNYEENHYTYVSQHNLLGNIEGEGRLGLQSIIQYYWFMGAASGRKGLDAFHYVDCNTYYFTSSIFEGHSVKNTIEATLKR